MNKNFGLINYKIVLLSFFFKIFCRFFKDRSILKPFLREEVAIKGKKREKEGKRWNWFKYRKRGKKL